MKNVKKRLQEQKKCLQNMNKSVEEIIRDWKFCLEEYESWEFDIPREHIQEIVKYFDDIDTFKQSL